MLKAYDQRQIQFVSLTKKKQEGFVTYGNNNKRNILGYGNESLKVLATLRRLDHWCWRSKLLIQVNNLQRSCPKNGEPLGTLSLDNIIGDINKRKALYGLQQALDLGMIDWVIPYLNINLKEVRLTLPCSLRKLKRTSY